MPPEQPPCRLKSPQCFQAVLARHMLWSPATFEHHIGLAAVHQCLAKFCVQRQ